MPSPSHHLPLNPPPYSTQTCLISPPSTAQPSFGRITGQLRWPHDHPTTMILIKILPKCPHNWVKTPSFNWGGQEPSIWITSRAKWPGSWSQDGGRPAELACEILQDLLSRSACLLWRFPEPLMSTARQGCLREQREGANPTRNCGEILSRACGR